MYGSVRTTSAADSARSKNTYVSAIFKPHVSPPAVSPCNYIIFAPAAAGLKKKKKVSDKQRRPGVKGRKAKESKVEEKRRKQSGEFEERVKETK
jgi:hypothetical protein